MKILRYKYYFLGAVLLAGGLFFTLSAVKPSSSSAASASNWKANRIIDDYNFYNGSAMSESSIQAFLNSKVPTCDTNGSVMYNGSQTRAQWAAANGKPQPPYKCLKSYTQNIPGKSADAYCAGAVGSGNKTAARIIYDVARACNINPKVLLVTLQKEQSLISDDWPWPIQYERAMGYGCPDTAPCDPDFAGFLNQVWYAARQFQRYKIQSQNYNFESGETSRVYYNPSSSCGYTNLTIYNHATAGLYNYTPYQPNSAALANLYGTGNSCSAYGNRNFWRMYSDWFGNPLVDTTKDQVLIGDWDGDDYVTPAVRRGTSYMVDNNNDGNADITVSWGRTTDQAIIGDWDGDGDQTLGLKRGGAYYLDNNHDGNADITVSWGRTNDRIFIGDWDGDGRDELGLRRDNSYYLDFENDGVSNSLITWGRSTDAGLTGDWDGDGRDELGLKRGSDYYLDYELDGIANENFVYTY